MYAETRSPEAMLRGREGLKYDLSSVGGEPILFEADKISLYFKTRKSSGLLYYNGKALMTSRLLQIETPTR